MVSLVTGSIGLIAAMVIVLLIRRDRLHVRFGMFWLAVALVFVVLGVYPRGMDRLAAALGIANGPDLAMTLAITVIMVKILVMDIARSHNETRTQRLVQRLAMLEAQIHRQAPVDEVTSPSPDNPE
jgi:hypothetical protein